MKRLRVYHDLISTLFFLVLAVSGVIYLVFYTDTVVGIYTVVHCVCAVAHFKRWELQLAYLTAIKKKNAVVAQVKRDD